MSKNNRMKATELRLSNLIETNINGNWEAGGVSTGLLDAMLDNPDIARPIPLTEEWLMKFGLEKKDKSDPIPLTEEWLMKFGLEKKDKSEWIYFGHMRYGYGRLEISIVGPGYCGCDVWDDYSLNHIKYVHQLQNLYFALTGEELTIQN